MATTTVDEKSLSLLKKAFASVSLNSSTDASKISSSIYPQAAYTDAEKKEIEEWVLTASHVAPGSEDAAKTDQRLSQLNTHLSTRTTILGSKPSVADIVVYTHIAPLAAKWSSEERTGQHGYHHIVRHIDFVQNSNVFHLGLSDAEKISINQDDVVFKIPPVDAKAEKERKKKEKEAAIAATAGSSTVVASDANTSKVAQVKENIKDKFDSVKETVAGAIPTGEQKKKEKKPKAPKPVKEAPKEKPLSPSLIDLRVGHILKAIQHPNADSLFVSTIAMGDAPGTDNTSEYEGKIVRTVCSGLNGLIPLEDMQNRKIVAVANLKPVTMRGIKSCAMVLAASPKLKEGEVDDHKGPVELVNVPAGAEAGDKVFFEGWEGEPEGVLNPKKKIWETLQPGFTTTDGLEVAFDAGAVESLKEKASALGTLKTKAGVCTVGSLKGATVR